MPNVLQCTGSVVEVAESDVVAKVVVDVPDVTDVPVALLVDVAVAVGGPTPTWEQGTKYKLPSQRVGGCESQEPKLLCPLPSDLQIPTLVPAGHDTVLFSSVKEDDSHVTSCP